MKLAGLTAASIGGLAFNPLNPDLPPDDQVPLEILKIVRVAIRQDEIWAVPKLKSTFVGLRRRDELVRVLEEFEAADGPVHNPRWYRVIGGYMHTAHLAPVETHLQRPVSSVKPEGEVFEVTVPFTQSMRYSDTFGWEPLYRLYYRSTHWVKEVASGPDGQPWYVIEDDFLHVDYFAPAIHLRRVPASELIPITPEITDKRIEVSLAGQSITCYEAGNVVLQTEVSTGIPSLGPTSNGVPTATPRGTFNVSLKTPVRHMGDGHLTSDIHAYELPGVPWSTFFTETGVAFHGTYWHDNFGGRMSHGCVNMRVDEAKWLYRWTTPPDPLEAGKWHVNGFGTRIEVV